MNKAFSALLWKESREALPQAVAIGAVFALMLAWSVISPASVGGDPDPARHFSWFVLLGGLAAVSIGYWQTARERDADIWAFALHRPANGVEIFGAKLAIGISAVVCMMFVPFSLAMWRLSIPDARAVPFDRSYWLPGIADVFTAIMCYAGGLYVGSHRRNEITRLIGIVAALVGAAFTVMVPSFWMALAIAVAFSGAIIAAAWSDFMAGSDFEAQPSWGRGANILVGIPAVAVLFIIVAMGGKSALGTPTVEPRSHVPQVMLTNTGQVVQAAAHEREMRTSGVISSAGMATDLQLSHSMVNASYREPRRWVARLFVGVDGAPLWYYDRRLGLIWVYDMTTQRLAGWIGPDGYSEGAAKPAKRFSGALQLDLMRWPRLMVLGSGVYVVRDLAKPWVLFAPPPGETILDASESRELGGFTPFADGPWGAFVAVSTDKRTYVVDTTGAVQLSVPHPESDHGRTVQVYRAPGPSGTATYIWYSPRRATMGDTLNHVLEFRQGSSTPAAEQRFAGIPYAGLAAGGEPPAAPMTVPLGAVTMMVPAVQVYAASRGSLWSADALVRSVSMSVLVALLFGGLTFWLCRRNAFSKERTISWTSLATLTGLVGLAVMWMFVERPAPGAIE